MQSSSSSSSTESLTDLTIFKTLAGPFPEVKYGKIRCAQFLQATEGIISLLEKFGKVFGPILTDMVSNLKILSNNKEKNGDNFEFLEDMVLVQDSQNPTVTDALMWLRRELHFFSIFFDLIIEAVESEEKNTQYSDLIRRAYRDTLEPFQGWIGKQLCNLLSRNFPDHRTLFYVLANGQYDKEKQVIRDLKIYNYCLRSCLNVLSEIYHDFNLEVYQDF